MPRVTLIALVFALLIAIPFAALADGDARAATPVEREYALKVQGLLDKALPPVPDGWTAGDRTEIKPLTNVSTGVGKDPMHVEFVMEARDEKKIEEASLEENKVCEEVAQRYTADQTAKMVEEMQKKLDVLSKQMEEAIGKNDVAAIQRITKEIEEAQAPVKTMGDAMNKELKEKVAVVKARDAHLQAVLSVNAYDIDLSEYASEAPVAGHQAYWHENSADQEGDFEGEWLAFAGAWKAVDQEGRPVMTPAWNLGLPHTTAQNLVVKVRGNKARGRRFLEAVKWNAVGDLLSGK